MNILLINPSQSTVYGTPMKPSHPPLGILQIASCLQKEGHFVRVIDYDNDNLDKKKFIKYVLRFKPDLVGLTATTSTIKHSEFLAKEIKKYLKIPIILGGIHATIAPEKALQSQIFKFILVGEAEHTVIELIREMQKSKPHFAKIKGICYLENNKPKITEPRELVKDLDTLPFPAVHLLKNEYNPPDALQSPVISIMTSRGCPGRCTYCCTKNIFGFRLRFRSVKNMIHEIESLLSKGIKEIQFMDDNFTVHKKRVLQFRDEVLKRKINASFVFGNGIRADTIDEDILQALKDLGVTTVGFGVESGNQQILENIKKDIELKTVEKAYKLCKKFGFQTWAFFIIGLPGETKQTARDTIDFAKKINPDFAKFLILKPYPGSEVFKELNDQGLIFNFDYENYGVYTKPVHKLPGLTSKEIEDLQKQAFREFYIRPSKIMQHVLRMRSFTQLKLNFKSAMFVLTKMFSK